MIREKSLAPVVKWAGGKARELPYLLPLFPPSFGRYIDPFVGGGAVYLAVKAPQMLANDLSPELINLYTSLRDNTEPFLECLQEIWKRWKEIEERLTAVDFLEKDLILNQPGPQGWERTTNTIMEKFEPNIHSLSLFKEFLAPGREYPRANLERNIKESVYRKLRRMERLSEEKGPLPGKDFLDNIESALKGAFYSHLRFLYNNFTNYWEDPSLRLPLFYFLREFCYSSMFRYNKRGGFNVPYGGISYNRKDFGKKIAYLNSPELHCQLEKTEFFCLDFAEFFAEVSLEKDDFVFLDPPYDSDFSTYAGNSFSGEDQKRLAEILHRMPAKFLLVIKNSKLIRELYLNKGFWVVSFAKNYLVSFQNRNDKKTRHLIITNYDPDTHRGNLEMFGEIEKMDSG